MLTLTSRFGAGFSATGTSACTTHIGFDLGTSGCRISVVEKHKDPSSDQLPLLKEIYTEAVSWSDPSQKDTENAASYDDPEAWMNAIETLLAGASKALQKGTSDQPLSAVASICVSGTSASCLVVDVKANKVTRKARMYNYDVVASRGDKEDPIYSLKATELLDTYAPPRHTARARSGSLAKLLTWNEERKLGESEVLCHQADYVAMRLRANDRACGAGPGNTWTVSSDWHNCLKLGYDVQKLEWPSWMKECLSDALADSNNPLRVLPQKVISPGEPMGTVSSDVAERFGLSADTVIVGGTTDSNAAFFAAAGAEPVVGTAVTSLGSTLAIKYLSQSYVEDADRGVYSHRVPSIFSANDTDDSGSACWLAGGASNVGCAVLRQEEFSNEELVELSAEIDPNTDSSLEYYPLVNTGERFPVADSNKEPLLTPVPESRRDYLHGILQGISNVERDGFQILGELGATPAQPSVVLTCGGGSRNDMWSSLRERRLNEAFDNEGEASVKVSRASNTEASFGAAILASATF
ncbi:FGGY family of carbohydrate kinases, C-terminal domain [Seminavis robusta]|uniref:FGGY family of carbohydrate kinases, C-terminal domain n=1 Tax=Seminavis robusta TaxID=568900 RepID=A0A9N8DDU8_9STRA|nr:FGGY family of carbohydrate kinases, C-terminal domain [Seminavis robusta]|eukprot:Sro27_g018120.1 FGGY family of carbohydrate kinases, C-terminal domain (525) ;mRNA; f:43686-45429